MRSESPANISTAERLLTIDECARRTATSCAFWRKLVLGRAIPVHRIGSRLIRIAEQDFQAYLKSGLRPPRVGER
jgi:excisionase family DNA binding protein